METVNKYLINEGNVSSSILSLIKSFQVEHEKQLTKFKKLAVDKFSKIYDLEGLEDFRDMGMNRVNWSADIQGIISSVIEDRIEQLYQEETKYSSHLMK